MKISVIKHEYVHSLTKVEKGKSSYWRVSIQLLTSIINNALSFINGKTVSRPMNLSTLMDSIRKNKTSTACGVSSTVKWDKTIERICV